MKKPVRTALVGLLAALSTVAGAGAAAARTEGTPTALGDVDLRYRVVSWDVPPGADDETLQTRVPRRWDGSTTERGERTFLAQNGIWRLRVDGDLDRDRTPRQWRRARVSALAGTPGFTVLGRSAGRMDREGLGEVLRTATRGLAFAG